MAETVKKGARITGADRAKLGGELTKKYAGSSALEVADQPDAVQDDGAQIASGAFDPALTLDTETVLAEVTDAEITDAEITDAEITDAEITDAEITDAAAVTGPDVIDADTDRS